MQHLKIFGRRSIRAIVKFFFAVVITILSPILKIRAGIPWRDSRLITKYYLLSVIQLKQFFKALRVFRLLFFKVAWKDASPDFSVFHPENEPKKDTWEIGQWFSVNAGTLQGNEPQRDRADAKFFSIGREAISSIIKTNSFEKKVALLPVFTCFTVLDPFTQDGWKLYFYRYNKDLSVDDAYFLDVFRKAGPTVCVFQPLSGMGFTKAEGSLLDYVHQNGCMTVVDQTQDVYNSRSNPSVDYYCGSLRKWYPFPDGAFLYSDKHALASCDSLPENNIYRNAMGLCMFARYMDSVCDNPFYRYLYDFMWAFSVAYISGERITPHTMSVYSRKILKQQDNAANTERRIENFRTIYQGIKDLKTVKPAFGDIGRLQSIPLSFPIYAKNRNRLCRFLSERGIGTQLLWDKPPYIRQHVKTDGVTEFIYQHILSLPCDQRYDVRDMQKMVAIIREYDSKDKA